MSNFFDGLYDMEDKFDSVIKDITEDFETVPTTEDPRTGIDRRHQVTKEFPLKDSNGNVVDEDRRLKQERRSKDIDIDDITEYVSDLH